jgi:hypothetical protein
MKTIQKEYNLYKFEELDQKAKDKAREKFNEHNEYYFLTDNLREYIHEELTEAGIKVLGVATSANPSIKPYYSLSYCQGDGLMFEAILEDKDGNTYNVKHAGHYYHERSTNIVATDKNDEYIDSEAFNEQIYIPICKRVAQRGYDEIEYEDSEECFAGTCEANEYTFLSDGTMFNE